MSIFSRFLSACAPFFPAVAAGAPRPPPRFEVVDLPEYAPAGSTLLASARTIVVGKRLIVVELLFTMVYLFVNH